MQRQSCTQPVRCVIADPVEVGERNLRIHSVSEGFERKCRVKGRTYSNQLVVREMDSKQIHLEVAAMFD